MFAFEEVCKSKIKIQSFLFQLELDVRMNWYQVTVTHKTWLFSLCEAFFFFWLFPLKRLFLLKTWKMQQTKWRARPASCEADAANFTFRCTVPSLDETVTYDTYVLNFNNCPPAMKVVSGLAAEQSPPLGGWASPQMSSPSRPNLLDQGGTQ